MNETLNNKYREILISLSENVLRTLLNLATDAVKDIRLLTFKSYMARTPFINGLDLTTL